MNAREINKAMAAHGVWKVRLREAIESGASDFSPTVVAKDGECEFGRWLNSIPVAERQADFWPKVQSVHARFHLEAGRILQLALTGRREEALSEVSNLQGPFVTTSIELTMALNEWKKVSA